MPSGSNKDSEPRDLIARAFTIIEDVVYIGLGLLLAGLVIGLLVQGFIDFGRGVIQLSIGKQVIGLLDRILLILLIVEILYTVQVSFREHALAPEPFILVGLISVIRRVLLLTAEFGEVHRQSESAAQLFVLELAVLAVLILALAGALVFLRRSGRPVVAERA